MNGDGGASAWRLRAPRGLAWIAACVLPVAWAGAGAQELTGAEPERPPDVLLIVLDDVNDWVGHLGGHPGARTPAMDRLAERGTAFTNAHCAIPVCNLSRASMLGGRLPREGFKRRRPLEGVLDLPAYFSQSGYTVAVAGKVFHDSERAAGLYEHFALDHGAQVVKPLKRTTIDLTSPAMWRDDLFDWMALELPDAEMPDYRVATWAGERLQRDDEEPLFLAVGLTTPHLPWYLPSEYFDLHALDQVQLPEVRDDDRYDLPAAALDVALTRKVHDEIVERELWAGAVQAYLASVTFADRQLGRLLDALDRSPRADRTIVVLTSDHGYHLGEKLHWRKFSLWEEATHVPLVISVPGADPAQCSRPVDLLSLYATLCDLARVPVPEHVEGVSLAPLIADPQAPWEHAAFTSFRGHRALRTERWRYILYADGGEELYDHDQDPGEFENLARLYDYRDVRAELNARLVALSGE